MMVLNDFLFSLANIDRCLRSRGRADALRQDIQHRPAAAFGTLQSIAHGETAMAQRQNASSDAL